MSNGGNFFLEFMEPLVGGLWDIIKAIGQGFLRIFNVINYFDVINKYQKQGVGVFLIIIAVIILFALFGLIAFLIYRLIRRIGRFRHNMAHEETLVEEIENLNNDIIRLRTENQKLMQMSEENELDENGNIKNQLESGESRFFKLSKIDERFADYVAPALNETITLSEFCEQFRNYAARELGLYYTIDLIRLFVSSFGSNRLIILQGISGTGKTSLAHAFGRFVKNESTIASVQPSWRDSTEIYGYFNEFTKRFNETEVLAKLYEARYNNQIYVTVLDEMNIARVEYYFAEMLSVLELPSEDEWIISLVPNVWDNDPKLLDNGRFKLPTNMWFVGTINNDDSTFMVTDKVYDRAMPINIDTKGVEFDAPETEALDITADYFKKLIKDAQEKYAVSEDTLDKIAKMDDYVIAHFRIAFGNRILKQLKEFVPVYMATGGNEIVAVDYIIANKILRKFEQLNLAYIRGEIDGFIDYLNELYGKDVMVECIAYLERLKKQI